jgi:signal transduction histidine kinase
MCWSKTHRAAAAMTDSGDPVGVLVVEDDPDQSAVLQATLASVPGFHVAAAAGTLAEALAAADERVSVAILDLDLPDSPASETVRRFCAAKPEVAVIVLTGHGDEQPAEDSIRSGAQDYLTKGLIRPDVLSRVIRYSLERKVVERRLRASERKNREFAGDVAHELRTPLTVLKHQVDELDDGGAREQMQAVIDRMARSVEQILAYAEADHIAPARAAPVDLVALAREEATELAPLALKSGRMIAFDDPGGAVSTRGDAPSIRRAVRNLIENALKYSNPDTTVRVGVTAAGEIVVQDRGPGVPKDERESVFERFLRRDRRPTGSGLGLSIVRKIMDAHGGDIRIADARGGGARFSLRFPLDTEGHDG